MPHLGNAFAELGLNDGDAYMEIGIREGTGPAQSESGAYFY